MREQKMSCPTCHWVEVTDARGRIHMEARWDTPMRQAGSHAA